MTRCVLTLLALLTAIVSAADPAAFRFAILGDRTGDAQAGVFEQVWKEVDGERPSFVVTSNVHDGESVPTGVSASVKYH